MRFFVLALAPCSGLALMLGLLIQAKPDLWPWDVSLAAYAMFVGWTLGEAARPDPEKKEDRP